MNVWCMRPSGGGQNEDIRVLRCIVPQENEILSLTRLVMDQWNLHDEQKRAYDIVGICNFGYSHFFCHI